MPPDRTMSFCRRGRRHDGVPSRRPDREFHSFLNPNVGCHRFGVKTRSRFKSSTGRLRRVGSPGGRLWGRLAQLATPRPSCPVLRSSDHDHAPVAAFVARLGGLATRLQASGARRNPTVFKRISEKVGVITRLTGRHSVLGNRPGMAAAPVASLTWPAVMTKQVGRPSPSMTADRLGFMPPLVRPIRPPR